MRNLLKFSYFFVLLGMLSCGETGSKKTDKKSVEVNQVQEEDRYILLASYVLLQGLGFFYVY